MGGKRDRQQSPRRADRASPEAPARGFRPNYTKCIYLFNASGAFGATRQKQPLGIIQKIHFVSAGHARRAFPSTGN